jgi:hypothetical protein
VKAHDLKIGKLLHRKRDNWISYRGLKFKTEKNQNDFLYLLKLKTEKIQTIIKGGKEER